MPSGALISRLTLSYPVCSFSKGFSITPMANWMHFNTQVFPESETPQMIFNPLSKVTIAGDFPVPVAVTLEI